MEVGWLWGFVSEWKEFVFNAFGYFASRGFQSEQDLAIIKAQHDCISLCCLAEKNGSIHGQQFPRIPHTTYRLAFSEQICIYTAQIKCCNKSLNVNLRWTGLYGGRTTWKVGGPTKSQPATRPFTRFKEIKNNDYLHAFPDRNFAGNSDAIAESSKCFFFFGRRGRPTLKIPAGHGTLSCTFIDFRHWILHIYLAATSTRVKTSVIAIIWLCRNSNHARIISQFLRHKSGIWATSVWL